MLEHAFGTFNDPREEATLIFTGIKLTAWPSETRCLISTSPPSPVSDTTSVHLLGIHLVHIIILANVGFCGTSGWCAIICGLESVSDHFANLEGLCRPDFNLHLAGRGFGSL